MKPTMKQYGLIILSICILSMTAQAQSTDMPDTLRQEQEKDLPADLPKADTLSLPLASPVISPTAFPSFDMYGITPFSYNYATWKLHEGFNASIGMSLTFSPSKYAPSGVGFGQDAAFMYALPVNNRLSVAAGLYATHMDWGHLQYQNVGIAGVAAYRLTERISIYAYGNKSLMPQRAAWWYPLPNYTPDRIGGMVNFKLGESSSISIGVEGRKNDYPWWY